MITMFIYSHIKKELRLFKETGFEIVCRLSEEDWDFRLYHDMDSVCELLERCPLIDIAMVDVTQDGAVVCAERLRCENADLYMIVLTDAVVSPVTYIKPTIRAASLIMRPVNVTQVKTVFTDAVRELVRQHSDGENNPKTLVIDSKEGKRFIPYEHILFFESREKKIFVNTATEEYAMYDTLEEIEKKVSDSFVRCHRSYIVAKQRIKQVMLSQGVVILDGDFQIPLSRSYKKVFKELSR